MRSFAINNLGLAIRARVLVYFNMPIILFSFEEVLPEDFFTDTLQVLNGNDMPICKATAGDYRLFQSTRYLRLVDTDRERIKKMMDNE